MRKLTGRLAKLERDAAARPRRDLFEVVEAVPVWAAGGRRPGLYHAGPPGSTAGELVYDPAAGDPAVPEGRLAPWGLLIVCEPASFPRPEEKIPTEE